MTTQIDAAQFRRALGSFTTGVTIVTTQGEDGKDYGLTANSFNSVSMDPPMVLWSLGKKSTSLPVFAATDHFAVHILAADQEAVSNRFSKSGTDKFAGCAVTRGHGGVPLLEGCSARFECRAHPCRRQRGRANHGRNLPVENNAMVAPEYQPSPPNAVVRMG